jgi:hypothetical protein
MVSKSFVVRWCLNLECGGRVPIHRDSDTALDKSLPQRQPASKAPSPLRSAGALQTKTLPVVLRLQNNGPTRWG